jgi:hypothetical protein
VVISIESFAGRAALARWSRKPLKAVGSHDLRRVVNAPSPLEPYDGSGALTFWPQGPAH